MSVIVTLYLDTRVQKTDGYYPIKIRVNYLRHRKYYAIMSTDINPMLTGPLSEFAYQKRNFSVTKELFEKVMSSEARGKFKSFQTVLKAYELKNQSIADGIKPFRFELYENSLEKPKVEKARDVYACLQEKIDSLKSNERYTTASTYENTLKSFKKFLGKRKCSFEAITGDTLTRYIRWMVQNNKSETTASIYLRNLRCIFNEAIASGVTKHYPFTSHFKRGGFKIPESNGRKMALDNEDLKAILNYECPENHPGKFYFDSWKMMYLMQGINPKDLCLLKYSNIKDGFIVFVRAKTKSSKSTVIDIPINKRIENLISTWGNHDKPKNYIWPVINTVDVLSQTKQIAQFVKMVNKYTGLIAKELGVTKEITCYTARHSYATMLMRHGAPVSFISKSLGHTSTNTTDNYLSSFEGKQKIEWQQKVTEF